MSVRASVERKRKEHARETARRQRQWQDMKRKAEEEAARAALDVLERRKCERARLAKYMREGRAAPKQTYIGKETLRKETGGRDENELPSNVWPVKSPEECREDLLAGVKQRMRERHVLQAAQLNGSSSQSVAGREESKGAIQPAQEVRNGFGKGPNLFLDQAAELPSTRRGGLVESQTLLGGTPALPVERPGQKEVTKASLLSEEVDTNRPNEQSPLRLRSAEEKVHETRKASNGSVESAGRLTDQLDSRTLGHRRPRWNTRVIQEYETAKLLRKRAWERNVQLEGGRGAQPSSEQNEGAISRGVEETAKRREGQKERPTLAAREVPWLLHEDSKEHVSEQPTTSSESAQPVETRGVFRKRSPREASAVASKGSVLMTHSPPRTAEPNGRKAKADAENEKQTREGASLIQSEVSKASTEFANAERTTKAYTSTTAGSTKLGNIDGWEEERRGNFSRLKGTAYERISVPKEGQRFNASYLAESETAEKGTNDLDEGDDCQLSTNQGKARGSLGESMSALQLELAQMQASSSWATRRHTPENEEAPGESQLETSDDGHGMGKSDRGILPGNVGQRICVAEHQNECRQRQASVLKSFNGGLLRHQEQPICQELGSLEKRGGKEADFLGSTEGRGSCIGKAGQSLADFLELEVEADKMTSREAYLKQRALTAANERRRLMQVERKRPISAESIPECVEGEEKESVFTQHEEAVCKSSVNSQGTKGNNQNVAVVGESGNASAAKHVKPPGKHSSKFDETSAEEHGKMEGKNDLTARLAAEVVALRARLAAREAEILRIRNAEKQVETQNQPREACRNNEHTTGGAAATREDESCKEEALQRTIEVNRLQKETENQGVRTADAYITRGTVKQRAAERAADSTALKGNGLAREYDSSVRTPACASGFKEATCLRSEAKQDLNPLQKLCIVSKSTSDVNHGVNDMGSGSGLKGTGLAGVDERAKRSGGSERRTSAPADVSRLLDRGVSQDSLYPASDYKHGVSPLRLRLSHRGRLEVPRIAQTEASRREGLPSTSERPFEKLERERKEESQLESGRPFVPRVPYALPGESGISAARVWEAYQVSRTQTPLVRPSTRNDSRAPIAYAEPVYGQPQLIDNFPPTRMEIPTSTVISPAFVSPGATRGEMFVGRPQRHSTVRPKAPSELSLEEQSILASLQRLNTRLQGLPRRERDAMDGSVASAPIRPAERLHTGQSKLETRSTGAPVRQHPSERAAIFAPAPKAAWQKAKRSRTGITNGRGETSFRTTRLADGPTYGKAAPQRTPAEKEGVIVYVPAARSLLAG